MEPNVVTRRLAAVLIADVAGYSRLMERDESGTHVRLRALFDEVVKPAILNHEGHLIRTTGDGLLAEFPSATEALRAAIRVQRDCAERESRSPDVDPILLRIGLNVADIVFDNADIAGGGVNLAARLETLAEPGGICISQAFREQIHEDLGVTFVDAGVQRVKNISKPVRVIRVLMSPPSGGQRLANLARRLPLKGLALAVAVVGALGLAVAEYRARQTPTGPETLSVLVANFTASDSSDTTLAAKGNALAEQVYLAMSPDRNMMRVKRAQSAATTGAPLARYAVEGVLSKEGPNAYRVDARIVDQMTRDTPWGDRFSIPDLSDDNIKAAAVRIAYGAGAEVWKLETVRVVSSPPERPDPMDFNLLGSAAWKSGDIEKYRAIAARAQRAYPDNPSVLLMAADAASGTPEERLALVDSLTLRAVAADPVCPGSWTARSWVLERQGHMEAAREAMERAIKINPSSPSVADPQWRWLLNDGKFAEAVRPLDQIDFEYAKSGYLLKTALKYQCMARVMAEQPAVDACNRFFAEVGSEEALAWATAAIARQRPAAEGVAAGKRLRQTHPDYSLSAHRTRLADSGDYSQTFMVRFAEVVVPALHAAGIAD